jgi:uncharacterized protein (TIGR02466 family)
MVGAPVRRDPLGNVRNLFATQLYVAPLGGATSLLNRALLDEVRRIRARDAAGRRWSARNYPGGYTSYGSLDQLHRMSSTFIALRERIDRHVRRFARTLEWDLGDRRLGMTDCWANVMERGSAHGGHVHPQAVVSGTYYVQVPRGAPGLRFEDPRLARFMAAPRRPALHVTVPARAGALVLFESWLRHDVPPCQVAGQRVSLSFNYHW